MRIGLAVLVIAYVLSQFYRAFLAVLTPALQSELGATPEDLAFASGLWFIVFAVMQLPVGWSLDTLGPRKTVSVLLGLGGAGGAAMFAIASTPMHITLAMGLIGVGCAPVLMASYFIFARIYPAKVFATLAALVIGVGSFGNIASSAPLAWSVASFGWRTTMWGLAATTLIVALLLMVTVKDPERVVSDQKGSVLDLLKMPALWFIFPLMFVNYAPAAGIRGLWIGPYFTDVFGADAAGIGRATLVMSLAMVVANFVYGPLDRILGTRKWVVLTGNLAGAISVFTLFLLPAHSILVSTVLCAAVGFFGASFAVIVAHARSFFPAHLTGRGVTLINLFGIGGAGVFQFVTGPVHRVASESATTPEGPYVVLFLFFALLLFVGSVIYAFSHDRLD